MGAQSKNFSATQLACKHCGVNECNPRLVNALEDMWAIVGAPIVIDDAYRCAAHNAAVGGVKFSQHELGIAADIRIERMTPLEMYRAALLVPAFANGGIGVALVQGYIHVDVRMGKARWCYDAEGKESVWEPQLDETPIVTVTHGRSAENMSKARELTESILLAGEKPKA